MKRILFAFLIISAFTMLMCACQNTKSLNNNNDMFVTIGKSNQHHITILYDKDTKVMYSMSNYDSNSGILTLLVNADGTPKTWKESDKVDY